MAGTLTHAHFIIDVYDKLGIKSKELLVSNKEQLKVYAQNMDVLFFYNLFSLKHGKKIRNFGEFFHNNKSYDFFSTLINYIKYNNYQYNPDVISFLYGMLSHYVLDSNLHPYVVYKTGMYDKNNKETYKYNMKHNIMENYIDCYIVSLKENTKCKNFKCYNYCFNVTGLNKSLIEVIDFTYNEVFGIKEFHKYYLKSIKQMKKFYKLFRYDPIGIKKGFYGFVDLVCPKSLLLKKPLSFNIKLSNEKSKYYLNLNNKTWYYPTDKKIKSKESVLDIYNRCIDQTINIIKEINKFLYYDEKINLKETIKNNSYLTGKDCSLNEELKYFEY